MLNSLKVSFLKMVLADYRTTTDYHSKVWSLVLQLCPICRATNKVSLRKHVSLNRQGQNSVPTVWPSVASCSKLTTSLVKVLLKF